MSIATVRVLDVSKLSEMRAWTKYYNIARLMAFLGILCQPFSLWALFWTSPSDYPFLSSLLFVPLLTCGCVVLLSSVGRRDRFLRLLLGGGIALRLAAAGAYVWAGYYIFQADAFHYWTMGVARAGQFSAVGWAAFPPPYTSSNLVNNLCAIITLVTGNALPTLFAIFAFAALWGAYFFYRAFCIAFPNGNRGLYGLLVFLLPSSIFWSSAIGKDAMEQLFIGIAAYGFAKVATKLDGRSIFILAIGVAGAAAFRPHIGAMLAISMLLPFVFSTMKGGWMTMSARILLLPVLAGSTYFMARQAQSFVSEGPNDLASTTGVLEREHTITAEGGSTFNQGTSLPTRIIESPFLLFRPFPWEVHNLMAAVSSVEGMGLAFLVFRKRREFWPVVRAWRQPYIGFILGYTFVFAIIFSAAISNFGIIARERMMLFPVVLMLFCARLPSKSIIGSPALQRYPRVRSRWSAPQLGPSAF